MDHNAFFSPFVIPVAGMALALGIVLIGTIANFQKQKLLSEERLTALAKGLPVPPLDALDDCGNRKPHNPRARLNNTRQGGILCIAIGIGLGLFSSILFWVTQERATLIVGGAGLIPLCVGVGMLIDYFLEARDFGQSQCFDSVSQPRP